VSINLFTLFNAYCFIRFHLNKRVILEDLDSHVYDFVPPPIPTIPFYDNLHRPPSSSSHDSISGSNASSSSSFVLSSDVTVASSSGVTPVAFFANATVLESSPLLYCFEEALVSVA
jgi:hypothetical protein